MYSTQVFVKIYYTYSIGLCVQYDTIVKVITEHPEDTTKLVKLMKYVEELDAKDLLVIKVNLKTHVFTVACYGDGMFFANCFAKTGSTVNTSNIFHEYIMCHGCTNGINSPGRTTNQLPEF